MKNHAIILPGQLRCIDDNFLTFIESCKETATIFIVTDKAFSEESRALAYRYDADVVFVEDASEADIGISRSDFHYVSPEFIKLEIALKYVVAWEGKNCHTFEYIHRFRTDVIYSTNFCDYIKPLVAADSCENSLYLDWCIQFSGVRDAMLKLIGLTKFQLKYKSNKDFFNHITQQINVKALKASSYHDPFLRSFPVAILASMDDTADFHKQILIEFPSYIDAAESFVKRMRLEKVPDLFYALLSGADNSLVRSYWGEWYPSFPEHIFFLYMNLVGLSSRAYASWMPLKYARHASTPFTYTIFSQIQEQDYSFLEQSYAWDQEIELFKQSGGNPGNALQKLTCIDLSSLSDSACMKLYGIIDLLDCPRYLLLFRKEFVKSILTRGVDPPVCLRPHFNNAC